MEGSGQHSFICSFLHSFILSHTHKAQNLLGATKDTGMGKWCLPAQSSRWWWETDPASFTGYTVGNMWRWGRDEAGAEEGLDGAVAVEMDRVEGCESSCWSVNRPDQGPAGFQRWGRN